MTVGELSISKVMMKDVLAATPETTAMDVLRLMSERDVGSVVITRGGRPVGMFTPRDLVPNMKLMCEGLGGVPVGKIMTRRLVTILPDRSLEEAYRKMMDANCRHLLIVNKDKSLAGIISMKDLVRMRQKILEVEVEKNTREIAEVRDKLSQSLTYRNREMAFAGNFQRQLIDMKFPKIRNLKVSAKYEQADNLGGDYFSFVSIDRDHVGILMADVMGHGITSAMISIEIKMQYDLYSRQILYPGVLITEICRTITRTRAELMPPGFFVAGCCCVLNLKTLHLRYTQFGLPGPGVFRADTKKYESLKPCQVPIGIKIDAVYPENDLYLNPGDKLLLYTDGCIEQRNPHGKMLGQSRFINQFKRLSRAGSRSITSELYKFVIHHTGHSKHTDDIAILLLEFMGARTKKQT